jgi:ketosteroid isomerase-like protein
MHRVLCPLLILLAAAPAFSADRPSTAQSADIEAIQTILKEYRRTQDAGDLMGQGNLMTPDRVWINQSGTRRTDNVENMKYQQAAADAEKKRVPGIVNVTMDQDVLVKFYGEGRVAIVSFYRVAQRFYPPGTSKELMDEYGRGGRETGTVVLEKQSDGWKIVHTHWSG